MDLEDIDILKTKLIFGKYKILKLIAKGCFGQVYLGVNILNRKYFAIKIENRLDKNFSLEKEAYILYNIKGPGIPSILSFGRIAKYNILVETLLGKSLEEIWKENNCKLNIKDICMIAIQTLERIEYVHSKFYLHRDIKPANFLIGNPDDFQIYLIDFGIAKKYRSSRTGKHIKNEKINKLFGTSLFMSMNVVNGKEQSRKDDLESLGYMYIFLHTGELPWSRIKATTIDDMIDKIIDIKEKTSLDDLCKNMPNEMYLYLKYVRNLIFNQKPDYTYLKNLFLTILAKNGLNNDNLFSWIEQSNISRICQFKNPRRSSFKSRLIRKLINSYSKKEPEIVSSSYDFISKKMIDDSRRNENEQLPKERKESLTTNKDITIDDQRKATNSSKIINNLKIKNNNINLETVKLNKINDKKQFNFTYQRKEIIEPKLKFGFNNNEKRNANSQSPMIIININKPNKLYKNKINLIQNKISKKKRIINNNKNNSYLIDNDNNNYNYISNEISNSYNEESEPNNKLLRNFFTKKNKKLLNVSHIENIQKIIKNNDNKFSILKNSIAYRNELENKEKDFNWEYKNNGIQNEQLNLDNFLNDLNKEFYNYNY